MDRVEKLGLQEAEATYSKLLGILPGSQHLERNTYRAGNTCFWSKIINLSIFFSNMHRILTLQSQNEAHEEKKLHVHGKVSNDMIAVP